MNEQQGEQKLTQQTVNGYLDVLADGTATPGGGSAAALAAALGASLASMAARLTIGRPRYVAVQQDMMAWLERAELLRSRLAALVDEDAQAYARVTAAYALPKNNAVEITARNEAVQAALRVAAEAPLSVAVSSVEVLELLALLAKHGNRNASTDAAVAALLAHAALRGAVLNVLVNLNELQDEKFVSEADALIAQLMTVGQASLAETMAAIDPGE